jgi:amino-acid N-acetyltransferase
MIGETISTACVVSASEVTLRDARAGDVPTIHRLIADHVQSDHLLPRTPADIAARHGRFIVAERGGEVVGCAELASLSADVAEIRSLVVAECARGAGLGRAIVEQLIARAEAAGYGRLCAFTHQPGYFVHLGFSIVPHLWVREKVFSDCVGCPLFRACGQHAVVIMLANRRAAAAPMRAVA